MLIPIIVYLLLGLMDGVEPSVRNRPSVNLVQYAANQELAPSACFNLSTMAWIVLIFVSIKIFSFSDRP